MNRRRAALIFVSIGVVASIVWAFTVDSSLSLRSIQSALAVVKKHEPRATVRKQPKPSQTALVADEPNTLRLPPDVAKTLEIVTAPVGGPERSRKLVLSGALALDTNRLAHVHTRFTGEVVELGSIADLTQGTNGGRPITRPIRFGDSVEKGQILAVLWSSELGEKKSDYVDALSKLRLEQDTLVRLETLFKDQSVPERIVREERRNVEAAQIAVARVERTLRSWRLSENEITEIRREAEAVQAKEARRDPDREKSWARVELRAPLAGTILEINLAVGDIVATDIDLFKIADMTTVRVWAYVYEEDLPPLLALPRPFHWTIRLKSDPQAPPIHGRAEKIGDLIDPNQHTALVVGQVENPDGRMRAGQFITAQVELPPDPNEVEIPIAALVEDGLESIIFIQPNTAQAVYSMRRVDVKRRSGKSAFLQANCLEPSRMMSAGQSTLLRPGERVVISGAVELRAALSGLQNESKSRE